METILLCVIVSLYCVALWMDVKMMKELRDQIMRLEGLSTLKDVSTMKELEKSELSSKKTIVYSPVKDSMGEFLGKHDDWYGEKK